MDEKTDMEVLRDTYLRINNLIDFASHENDMRLREYTHELYMHSVRKVEPEVNKRKNMPTKIVASLIDNDDGLSTQKLIEELEDMASREYEPIHVEVKGLNDEEMQRNHMVFMSLVDRAKRDGHRRIERLKESFEQVTAHQKQIMRQAIDDYKQHRGFHRLKNRILELENQLSKQRTLLAERKYQYDIRKAESTQSAEELRTKYEFETEELIRSLLTTIDAKQRELEALQQRHEAIRKDIDRICKDLSVVLHDIEKEEKARLGKRHGRRTHINSKPKPENVVSAPSLDDSDSESTKSPAKAKKDEEVTIIDVFPFIKVGELTDDMIQQTYQLVDESASILRAKQEEKEYAEQRLAAKKNELAAILKSEESKALERLKKMVVGLEAKIDSDEKRAALLESLIKNLEQDHKAGANAGKTGNKGVLAPGASSGKDNIGKSPGLTHRRSRNVAYGGGAGGAGGKDSSGGRQRFDDEQVDSDDDGAARPNDDDADDDADEVDTGGAPADIERRRLRSLERQAKKRLTERKKPAPGAAESVASEGSNSLSFGTNDSNKFQALQAKFLQTAAPPSPHRAESPPKEISFASPVERPGSTSAAANAATKATTPQAGARPGSKPATAGSDAAGDDSRPGTVAQRFIAPSQLTKILATMEAFEHFLRPPAWALGASNVLIPYSQRPVLPVASAPKPAQSPSDADAAASRVPFASTSRGGGSQGAKTSSAGGPAPPSAPRSAKTPSSGGGPGRLMIEAHGIDGLSAQPLEQPRTLTQRLEDQLLAASRDDRHRLLSREEKATLEEEKAKQDYFMQSFGFHLALDQLQMLMELLTNWGGTAPEQTTLDNLKEVLAPAKGTTNILTTVMKVRTEEEELEDLERMRHQTQEVLLSLKLAYRQNKGLHHVLKDTTKLVQNETRRCDDVKRQLFAEIEGLRWEQHLQPGQYQQEMRALKEKIAELKGELRMWETKIRQQSKSNSRMSQALTDETTARKISEGIAEKLRQQQRQHHDGPLSSLSSITGRQIVQSGRPHAAMSSAVASVLNKHGLLAPGGGAAAGGGSTGAAPLHSQHKSQSSIATGVSAASSSILEELSDIDEGFDLHWSSFSQRSGDPPTKKASIAAPKRARVTTSSIASVVEEDASPASSSIAEGSTASRVKRTKRRRGKKAAPAKDKDDRDADDANAAPLRGSVALEADDDDDADDGSPRVSIHEIMAKPSKQHQTQHRKAKLTAEDAARTTRDTAPTRNSFAPADGDQTEKLQLYHDATDIYAQAMRDLSESQKTSR